MKDQPSIKRDLRNVPLCPPSLKTYNRNHKALLTDFAVGFRLGLTDEACTTRARLLAHADAFHPDFGNAIRHIEIDLVGNHSVEEALFLSWEDLSPANSIDNLFHFSELKKLWQHEDPVALCWHFVEFHLACLAPTEEESK